uniref:cytochrome P450 n=1 Tax=Streptomyces silaceus TaxID=545123 RepID=UPI0006EB8C92
MAQTTRSAAAQGSGERDAPAPQPKGFRSAELGWPHLERIPHPPRRLPLLGDILGANARTPLQDSMRMAHDLGPIFRRKAFGKEFVFVWGAELAADLADESRFAKHVGLGVANLRPVAGDGLFTAYNHEPNWQLAHDILAPGFSRDAMEGYHPLMLDVARQLTTRWDDREAAGRPVDVPGDMTKLTLETIARTGFGHDFGSFERSAPHPFVTAMVGTLSFAQRRNVVPPLLTPLMLRGASRRNDADMAYLNSTVDAVVAARRAASGRGGQGDLLDRMLEVAHPETGERLTPENIRRQVITFLVAGHETTSGALSFALHYLSRHPDVLARARAEV